MRVITLNDDEALIAYAKPIVAELRANMVRVDADYSATPFKAKISNAEQLRVHTILVIGGRDMEAGAVSVRLHHGGPQGAKPKGKKMSRNFELSVRTIYCKLTALDEIDSTHGLRRITRTARPFVLRREANQA